MYAIRSYYAPWALILLFAALALWLSNRRIALFTLVGLFFVWNLRLWEPTVSTIRNNFV